MKNFCERCGELLSEGMRFCEACGHPVKQPSDNLTANKSPTSLSAMPDKFCEQCGARLPKEARFCEECGQPISITEDHTGERVDQLPPSPIISPTKPLIRMKNTKFLWIGAILVVLIAAIGIGLMWWKNHSKQHLIVRKTEVDYIKEGIELCKKHQYDQGIILFNQAIELNPKSADAFNNRGSAYLDKGDLKQAISDYSHAIELKPNLAMAYNNRGCVYTIMKRWNLALRDYTKAIEIKPEYADAYFNRGRIYQIAKGKLNNAISDYTKAIEINPNKAEAYSNRGVAYYERRQLDLALSDFNKALAINPNLGEGYNNRAAIHYEKGRYDNAWQDIKVAQRLGHQVNPKLIERLRRVSDKAKNIPVVTDSDPVRAMIAFEHAIRNHNSQGILAAFSRTNPWRFVSYDITTCRSLIQKSVTFSQMEHDFKARKGWWHFFIGEAIRDPNYSDNFNPHVKWHRQGNTFFQEPVKPNKPIINYLKWRHEGTRWVIAEIGLPAV
jgi:tetratricopeptide (TPR) repeat protein/RNA polymerase subunit RPABC4/transcription elongation factor Spt4